MNSVETSRKLGNTAKKRRIEKKVCVNTKIVIQIDKKLKTQTNKKTCNIMTAKKRQLID